MVESAAKSAPALAECTPLHPRTTAAAGTSVLKTAIGYKIGDDDDGSNHDDDSTQYVNDERHHDDNNVAAAAAAEATWWTAPEYLGVAVVAKRRALLCGIYSLACNGTR